MTERKSYGFSKRSTENLIAVHPRMVAIVTRANEILFAKGGPDFLVLEGIRTEARQQELYGMGRTPAQLRAAGVPPRFANPKARAVTWTLNSAHRPKADGLGRAVDLLPLPIDWNKKGPFQEVAKAMFQAAEELNSPIRWGADWDRDGNYGERGETDSPHFEAWGW